MALKKRAEEASSLTGFGERSGGYGGGGFGGGGFGGGFGRDDRDRGRRGGGRGGRGGRGRDRDGTSGFFF